MNAPPKVMLYWEQALTPSSLTTILPTTKQKPTTRLQTTRTRSPCPETARDANGDGVVDAADFTVMVNNSTLKDDEDNH